MEQINLIQKVRFNPMVEVTREIPVEIDYGDKLYRITYLFHTAIYGPSLTGGLNLQITGEVSETIDVFERHYEDDDDEMD